MKVVFMGTPDFAVGTLEAIVGAGHEVAAVVTQPDKPKGRGGVMAMSPVKECALRHGLTVLQPLKERNPEFIDEIRAINPDVIVVVAFGQIIPSEIIHMTKFGCINVHASLLPKYRGASPIQWTVLDGCEYSGVTTMLMDEGIDTGDILETATVKLDERETGGSLFDRLSLVGAKLLVETLDKAEAGQLHPVKQDDSQSSYVRMMDKSFGLMDFTQPVEALERKVRALNPWPSSFTHMDEKLLKIWDATVIQDNNVKAGDYGKVKTDGKTCFMVACDGGYLSVNELQLEGKKRMKVEDFLRGYSIKEGTVLS